MIELVEVCQHIGPRLSFGTECWAQLQFCCLDEIEEQKSLPRKENIDGIERPTP